MISFEHYYIGLTGPRLGSGALCGAGSPRRGADCGDFSVAAVHGAPGSEGGGLSVSYAASRWANVDLPLGPGGPGVPARAARRSEVFERLDGLGQVAVELGHAGGEEGVDHGARQEAAQVRLEEAEHLGLVGLS